MKDITQRFTQPEYWGVCIPKYRQLQLKKRQLTNKMVGSHGHTGDL